MQWPHIGAVLSGLQRGRSPLPPFVSMRPKLENTVSRFVEQSQGHFAGWLGPLHDPMTIDSDPSRPDYHIDGLTSSQDFSIERLGRRRELMTQLNDQLRIQSGALEAREANVRRAYELLSSTAAGRDAFNLEKEPPRLRERFGMNPHGQSVLLARRLVDRGVPLVTVYWPNDGIKNVSVYWDTHSKYFIDLKQRLMPVTDQAFSALIDDLHDRGMLDETLVVWTGEFGRTPRIGQRNSAAGAGVDGRDHWPNCFTTVLAGGGVRSGIVYGKSDDYAAYPARDPVNPQDLIATVYHALGVPPDQTLNDVEAHPRFVRPGTAIQALLA